MKNFTRLTALATLATGIFLSSCEDTSTVGESLIDNGIQIVVDSTYTLSGHSVANTQVRSRTIVQLLGSINATGYGSLTSDVVTQFISSETLDTTGIDKSDIDSIKLVLGMPLGSFVGDSIVPMGLEVYPLTKQLPSPIYSSFDPTGYYNPSVKWGSAIYAATTGNLTSDDDKDESYRYINVDLPLEFAYSIFDQYETSPSTFATPQAFAKWFPGLYIKNSFGSGRMINIANTSIKMYYHRTTQITGTSRDTTINYQSTYMAVSPEVLTNNNIVYKTSPDLTADVLAGKTILAAPIGYDVEFEFPAKEIVANFKSSGTPLSVVNSLSMSIPAKALSNDYGIEPPTYIVMVKKSAKDKFFAKANLPDNINSFYATYSSATGCYEFSTMRPYLMDLLDKDEITTDDTEFVITPVTATFASSASTSSSLYYYYYGYSQSSSSTLESLLPYVLTPVMCTLELDKAKIKFTHSLQKF